MEIRPRHDLIEPDVFDVLSATWVMACNDEQPIITYEGIRWRLNLAPSFDLRGLIQSRGDLFRRGVSQARLDEWKNAVQANKQVPGWIRSIQNTDDKHRTIDKLTVNDVFRSQFRTVRGAPQSSLEVIDWGLRHIDRLRRASYEAGEKTAKSWQIWLVFAVGLLSIAATIIAALVTS